MSKRLRKDPQFDGPFADMCRSFVEYKRKQGYSYDGQIYILRSFDNFSKNFDIQNYEITAELTHAWSKRRHGECETYRSSRILVMRHFALFLTDQGYASHMQPFRFRRDQLHAPHIFTHEEIKRLFQALDQMEYSTMSIYKHKVFPMLYRMLYACGFRINEVLGLKICDVDLEKGIVHLTKTKNNVERLVPMSDSLTAYCRKYVAQIHAEHSSDYPFICTMHGEHYCVSAIERHFRDLLTAAKIPYGGKKLGPRIHDLRHTFACHQLYKWAKDGTDLMVMLPVLSKYLGHTGVLSTQWYLRLTAESYPNITEKMEQYTNKLFPEIGGELLEETD